MEIQLKALSQIAGGAKGLRYYTFGPEYNFPGNSYSDATSSAGGMLAGMACLASTTILGYFSSSLPRLECATLHFEPSARTHAAAPHCGSRYHQLRVF